MPGGLWQWLYLGKRPDTLVNNLSVAVMNRKLLFFINPISGAVRKKNLPLLIGEVMQKNGLQHELSDTRADGNYHYLPEKIKNEGITDVIICGGDGTVNQVGAYLTGTDVHIGIIPLGSGNGLALAAGIPRNSLKALELLVSGTPRRIDAFRLNNRFSCMLCGLGFDARVAHEFARQKKRGLASYVKVTIRNFFSSPSYPFIIESNGNAASYNAFFISIANSNQFGNHVTIAPKASLGDGLLDIVVVQKTNKLLMILRLLRQIRMGKLIPGPETKKKNRTVYYFQTDKLSIKNPTMAPLHIDGEAVETEASFDIRVIPSALKLIMP